MNCEVGGGRESVVYQQYFHASGRLDQEDIKPTPEHLTRLVFDTGIATINLFPWDLTLGMFSAYHVQKIAPDPL
jgi:hypothetical protein